MLEIFRKKKLIARLLQILPEYLDNIIVYSDTIADHLKRLERVFQKLREHGLKIEAEKCQFFHSRVKYLGPVVSAEGVATNPAKTEAVSQWPTLIVETDVSDKGLGAVLSQKQDGKLRVIDYASRGLRGAERNMKNYSSLTLELLAPKWAIAEKFREYLLGSKVRGVF